MRIDVISLFPEMFSALDSSITGRAIKTGLITLQYWNPRDFTKDKHRSVDDRPYGGGPGMVMMVEPLQQAIQAAKQENPAAQVIYLSPQGKQLNHQGVMSLAEQQNLILLCGRYEGVDERLIELTVDAQWSLGDYVLSGGELAAMVMIDAITRHIPGALGDDESAQQDSFYQGLLDCPHYTRPEVYADKQVPKVLLSGDHKAIATWRMQQALGRTYLQRPELLDKVELSAEQQALLDEFIGKQQDK